MIAKKNFSMDTLVDLMMTKLFLLAEYVCNKTCGRILRPQAVEPVFSNDIMSTAHFSNDDNAATKQVNSNAGIRSFERKQPRLKITFVEGELFQ